MQSHTQCPGGPTLLASLTFSFSTKSATNRAKWPAKTLGENCGCSLCENCWCEWPKCLFTFHEMKNNSKSNVMTRHGSCRRLCFAEYPTVLAFWERSFTSCGRVCCRIETNLMRWHPKANIPFSKALGDTVETVGNFINWRVQEFGELDRSVLQLHRPMWLCELSSKEI